MRCARRHKDARAIVVRTLFGVLRLASPRWWHCCRPSHGTVTFSPLAALLAERITPELLYLEAKFAGLASYGTSAKLLAEVLPLGRPLHAPAVRLHARAVAQRLEDELGEERFSFTGTCPAQREELPRPDLPIVVGLDGGYVHCAQQRSRRDGWFEVIAGKAIPATGRDSCFGFVQTYDTKPKRRLFEVPQAHGMAANQAVTFLTDGGEDIRDLPCYLSAQAEHLLDWSHRRWYDATDPAARRRRSDSQNRPQTPTVFPALPGGAMARGQAATGPMPLAARSRPLCPAPLFHPRARHPAGSVRPGAGRRLRPRCASKT